MSHLQFFSLRFAPVFAALLIIVLGTGTTYAAQAALPGDFLYTIKVGVNEPVREALAVSPEAKVAFHAEAAETRLEEAEALAAEGRLSAATSEQIETNLETHLAQAEEITTELEEAYPEDPVEVSAQLESVLSAHGSILAALGEESEDEETRERSTRLASRLTSRMMSARMDDGAAMATMAFKAAEPTSTEVALMITEDGSTTATSSEDMLQATMTLQAPVEASTSSDKSAEASQRSADQLGERAQMVLEEEQSVFYDMEASLKATTAARVEAEFARLEADMKNGRTLYEAEDYKGARASFSAVLGDASALGAYLRAEKKFNRDLLRVWIDNRFGVLVNPEIETELELEKGAEVKGETIEEEEGTTSVKEEGEEAIKGEKDAESKGAATSSNVNIKVDLGL